MPVHRDINDNALPGESFVDGEEIEDLHGHQTHCVGIISAKDNDEGMIGVAPKAKCLCVKGLSNSGRGSSAGIAKALEYCLDKNVDLVSMSLGSPFPSTQTHEVIKKLYAKNIPVICAAGNSGNAGVNYPAAFKECIAVAAYDQFQNIAYFSSKGGEVDVAAPGVKVYSTYLNNTYASMNGTSMACPFVAGVVALLISKLRAEGKDYTVESIRKILIETADDKGEEGKDNSWGYGIIDPDSILLNTPDLKPEPEPEPEPAPAPAEEEEFSDFSF